jgi:hypothetical protein
MKEVEMKEQFTKAELITIEFCLNASLTGIEKVFEGDFSTDEMVSARITQRNCLELLEKVGKM